MADRKKVQKIRTKRKVKAKVSKKNLNNKTQSINMNGQESDYSKKAPRTQNAQNSKTRSNKKHTPIYKSKTQLPKNSRQNREIKKHNAFSVVYGKKGEVQKKKLITICVSLIIIFSILIFCWTSPTGPVERITNAFEVMGSGEYPTVLSGTKTLAFQTVNNKAFVLTNSHLCGYTLSGKNFLQLQHNFSNPILDISEERTLIYNRESNKFIVANNSGSVFEQNLEQSVFCADISYDGSMAFACESASYSAQIIVFDKNMKQYYTWYLADGLVSDVTVSNNGRYVAVAVLRVKNGAFLSEIYCLDTNEKEPIFSKEFVGETVLRIESVSSSNFVCISDKRVSFVKWKNGEELNKNTYGAPSYFSNISNYHLAIFGETNHSDIVLFDSSGEIKHHFEYNGIIDDISVFDENIFVLSSNKVTYFDFYNTERKIINLENNADYIFGSEDGFVTINNINMDFVSTESKN